MKKFFSTFFILSTVFFFSNTIFASNTGSEIYSVFSDNFLGTNFYDIDDNIPESDTDGIKFYPWTADWDDGGLEMTNKDVEAEDAPEGKIYTTYIMGKTKYKYCGCGYTRIKNLKDSATTNMSGYTKIKFSARSRLNKNYVKKCEVGFKTVSGGNKWIGDLQNISSDWREFEFSVPNVDLADVNILFMMQLKYTVSDGCVEGEEFLDIDNIRWEQTGTKVASLNAVLRNVSDNTEVAEDYDVTFSTSAFRVGWIAADQYLDIDINTGDVANNNWAIRVFSSSNTAGLYNDEGKVLDMAWRVACSTLPYEYKDYVDDNGSIVEIQSKNTLEIGENWEGTELRGLYDKGKSDFLHNKYPNKDYGDGAKWWYPWFFVQAKNDTSIDSLVWNRNGCHTSRTTPDGKPTIEVYDSPKQLRSNPKLYFSLNAKYADFSEYSGSVIVDFYYE